MATYVLIHGVGDVGWYWHLVEAEVRERRHDVVAPDLPCDEDSAGLPEYADAVIEAIGDRTDDNLRTERGGQALRLVSGGGGVEQEIEDSRYRLVL